MFNGPESPASLDARRKEKHLIDAMRLFDENVMKPFITDQHKILRSLVPWSFGRCKGPLDIFREIFANSYQSSYSLEKNITNTLQEFLAVLDAKYPKMTLPLKTYLIKLIKNFLQAIAQKINDQPVAKVLVFPPEHKE